MNVLSSRREGLVREGVVEKDVSQSWGRSVYPHPHRPQREVTAMILKSLKRRRRRRRQWKARGDSGGRKTRRNYQVRRGR